MIKLIKPPEESQHSPVTGLRMNLMLSLEEETVYTESWRSGFEIRFCATWINGEGTVTYLAWRLCSDWLAVVVIDGLN